jgi:hypothetical protein
MMPILKQLLTHARSAGLESLWGRTLECCAVVGEASGKEKFLPDAMDMMRSMEAMQQSVIGEDAEAQKYLLRAWVGIARCLGRDFVPFLPLVMNRLITAISQDLSAGTGGIDLDDMEQRSDIELVETEDGCWTAVRTSAVEEQAKACQLVTLLAEKLQVRINIKLLFYHPYNKLSRTHNICDADDVLGTFFSFCRTVNPLYGTIGHITT